jgi:hypothetical protein
LTEKVSSEEMLNVISFVFFGLIVLIPVFSQYCPENYGVQTYPDEKYCDKFYLVSIPKIISV